MTISSAAFMEQLFRWKERENQGGKVGQERKRGKRENDVNS